MILFGRKAHHLSLVETEEENCKKCGNRRVVISLFQKYFHILWLPMFPIKKECASQCLSCREVQVEKKFSEEFKEIAQKLKKEHSTPIWIFTGIFILLAVMLSKQLFF